MKLDAPTLDDLDLDGRRVLVRVDFNVPLDEGRRITDDTRIRAALPTLRAILERGGTPLCLTHLGRPAGRVVEELRVAPVGERLAELLDGPLVTLDDSTGAAVSSAIAAIPAGATVLLENVRFHPGETRGDDALAREYARLGDCFVNDAFGSSHRDHASVSGVARHLPSAAGLLLQREMAAFARVLTDPERPLVAILGGAKVSDKLTAVDHLLERVDALLVGGGMSFTFLKAQGHGIGDSLVQDELLETCRAALAKAEACGVELALPSDHITADRIAADARPVESGPGVPDGLLGLDIGPRTRERYAATIEAARSVVWNGPMGVFEMEPFRGGTAAVGRALAACSGYTVVGGGDSLAALRLLGLSDAASHLSTGGGAMLELLEGASLPGIAALGRLAERRGEGGPGAPPGLQSWR